MMDSKITIKAQHPKSRRKFVFLIPVIEILSAMSLKFHALFVSTAINVVNIKKNQPLFTTTNTRRNTIDRIISQNFHFKFVSIFLLCLS